MALLDEQKTQDAQENQQQTNQQTPKSKGEETYQRLGLAAMKIIYSKPESDHVLEILRAGEDQPSDAVAQAAYSVIKRMQNEIDGIDPNIAFSVAPSLVALIFEMGMAAEIFTEETFPRNTDPQKLIGDALTIMAKLERGAQSTEQQIPGQQQGVIPQGQSVPQQQQLGV